MILREDNAAELLYPCLFASLTVCLTGKLLMPALKNPIAQNQNRYQTQKSKKYIEDMT